MSQMLELPDTLYRALEKEAQTSGMTLQGWIAARLAESKSANGQAMPPSAQTLADLFAGRIGRITGSKPTGSDKTAEQFADSLQAKRQAGHL